MSLNSIDLGSSGPWREVRSIGADGMLEVLMLTDEAAAEITRQMRVTIDDIRWEMDAIEFWNRHQRGPFAGTPIHVAIWFLVFLFTAATSLWFFVNVHRLWSLAFVSMFTPFTYALINWVRYVRDDYW